MKNLFAFNVKTGEYTYNNRIIKKIDSAVSEKAESAFNSAKAFEKKYTLPLYFKIIMYICGMFAFIAFFSVLRAITEGTSFSEAYNNASWLFYVAGACLIIFLMLFGISVYLKRKGGKDPELQIIAENLNSVIENSFKDLGVPEGAEEISVLLYLFRIKNGKQKRASHFVRYTVQEMKIYADTENLYLADTSCVTAIPFSDIKQITANKKRAEFLYWTKDEPIKSPRYKPYKVRAYQYGFTVKTYSVQINSDGEEMEILIPNYDIEILKTFVNAPVIELKQNKKK